MRNRILILYALGVLALTFSKTVPVLADPGFLDSSFGGGTGMVQIGFGLAEEYGQAVAFQSDGKYVVAGVRADTSQFMVVRYGTDNLPDPSFGSDGVVFITPPARPLYSSILNDFKPGVTEVIQPDGKIVVAGTISSSPSGTPQSSFFLMRLNPDGSLDGSFGYNKNGMLVYGISSVNCTLGAIALQNDGKIVTAGTSVSLNLSSSLVMNRLATDGTIDPSFNTVAVTNSSGAYALALEGDGNILVGGGMSGGGSGVMRFDTNGALDTTFGSGGKVVVPGAGLITALGIQPGGIVLGQQEMIVAAGSSSTNVLVARMSLSGVLDTSFNGTGVAKKGVSGQYAASVNALKVVATGSPLRPVYKMVVSGNVNSAGNGNQFVLARFNADGSVDSAFGNNGALLAQPTPTANVASSMVIASGPAIFQVGSGQATPCESDVVLARYNWADGSPDTNFNGTGVLVNNFGNRVAQANAVALQSDDKIVVAGSYQTGCSGGGEVALCRLNVDGTLDPSFGNGGRLVMAFGTAISAANALVIQSDGRIVITGTAYDGTNYSTLVARFLPNGLLDSSFGNGGSVITSIGTNSSTPSCITLQEDGKILVAAQANMNGNDFAILRYTTNGALDASWNGTGKLLTVIGSGGDLMSAIAVQLDGKVIVSGGSEIGAAKFSMIRCASNGALDNSFGSLGRVATEIGSGTQDIGYGMVLQPDQKIVLAGADAVPPVNQYQVALLRYNPNGTLDPTFGNNGAAIAQIGVGNSYAQSLARQTDGKLVAGCRIQNGSFYKFGVARFLGNGTLDTTYGYGGVNSFDFDTGTNEILSAMALDSQGRAVMVGNVENLFTVVRVLGDSVLRFTSITRQANGDILLQGTGVPQASHTLLKSSALKNANFITLASVTTDGAGNWQYLDTTTSGTTNRFYRLSYP